MIESEDYPEQDQVTQEHHSYPAGGEFLCYREVGLEKVPGDCGKENITDMPGPEQASPAEHPLEDFQRPDWPLENWCVSAGIIGFPETFFIVSAEIGIFIV